MPHILSAPTSSSFGAALSRVASTEMFYTRYIDMPILSGWLSYMHFLKICLVLPKIGEGGLFWGFLWNQMISNSHIVMTGEYLLCCVVMYWNYKRKVFCGILKFANMFIIFFVSVAAFRCRQKGSSSLESPGCCKMTCPAQQPFSCCFRYEHGIATGRKAR